MKTALTLALILVLSAFAFADVPTMINYQGRLTNSSGEPIDTTVDISFSICVDSTDGALCIWGETQTGVEIVDGLFNVKLGSVFPIGDDIFLEDNRWLHVSIGGAGGEAIEPATELLTSPYAFHVATVDGATGGTVAGSLDIDGSVGYDQLRLIQSYTPTGSADVSGEVGDVAWDDDFIYIKTNAGWKRTALSSF